MHRVKRNQYKIYDRWYYLAVRAMLHIMNVDDNNYEEVAQRIRPRLTVKQVKKALNVLESEGLIFRDKKTGTYRNKYAAISSGHNYPRKLVVKYVKSNMYLSYNAIDNVKRKNRHVSSCALAVSREGYDKITAVLSEARQKIMSIAKQCKNVDRVYQLNMQLFPVTHVPKDKKQ